MKPHLPHRLCRLLLAGMLTLNSAVYAAYENGTYSGSGNTNIDLTTADATNVRFNMVAGSGENYFAKSNQTYGGQVIIDGSSDPDTPAGLILNNGYSTYTYTFSGSVSGSGTISKTGGGANILKFTGDMDDFTGTINVNAGSTLSMGLNTYLSKVTTCSASSINVHTFNIEGKTVLNGGSAEQTADINIGQLTLGMTSSLTLGSTTATTINNITLNSADLINEGNLSIRNLDEKNSTIKNSGTLTLQGNIKFLGGIINSGTLNVEQSVVFDLSRYTPLSGDSAMYSFADSGTVNGWDKLTSGNVTGYDTRLFSVDFSRTGYINLVTHDNLCLWNSGFDLTLKNGSTGFRDGHIFQNSNNLYFTSNLNRVTLGEDVSVGTLAVLSSTMRLTGNGYTLRASDVNVDGTLELMDSGLKTNSISGTGILKISGSDVVQNGLTTTTDYSLTLTVAEGANAHINNSTLKVLHGDATQGSLALDNSEIRIQQSSSSVSLEGLTLSNDSSYLTKFTDTGKSLSIGKLTVKGSSTLGDYEDNGYAGSYNIAELASTSAAGDTLKLSSAARTSHWSTFNVGNATQDSATAFSGNLHLVSASYGNTQNERNVRLKLNDTDMLANAVLTFKEEDYNKSSHFQLALGNTQVTLAGIKDDSSLGDTDSAEITNDSGASSATLILNVGIDAATKAAIGSGISIIKQGNKKQSITGSMESFNGSISVEGGALYLAGSGHGSLYTLATGTTLGITHGLSLDSGKMLNITAGATLEADLALNGGTLSLKDWTAGSSLNLAGHALTNPGTVKLDLSGAEGNSWTLFSNTSNTTAHYSTATNYFTFEDEAFTEALLYFAADGSVTLQTGAAKLYWEGSNGAAWDSASWSATDGDSSNLVSLSEVGSNVAAVFSGAGDTPQTVLLTQDAEVNSATFAQGQYALIGTNNASLNTRGDLCVQDGAVLDLQSDAKVASLSVGAASTLLLNHEAELMDNGRIRLGAGARLQLNKLLSMGEECTILVEGAGAILSLSEQQELQISSISRVTPDASLSLAGSGMFHIGANSSLGNSITLEEDWKGTIKLTAASFAGLNLNTLGHAGSSVEFCGVTGYLNQANGQNGTKAQTYAPNLILTNNGDAAAWSINDGWYGDTRTFTGSISGEGTLIRSNERGTDQYFIFAGDTSAWTGLLSHSPGNAGWGGTAAETYVTFSGSKEINVTMDTNGKGVFHVTLDDENLDAGSTVTVNSSISATGLTVTEGTTALLKNTTTLDGSTLHGQGDTPATLSGVQTTADGMVGLGSTAQAKDLWIEGLEEVYEISGVEMQNVHFSTEMEAVTLLLTNVSFDGQSSFSVGEAGTIILSGAVVQLSLPELGEGGVFTVNLSGLFQCKVEGELTFSLDTQALLSAGYTGVDIDFGSSPTEDYSGLAVYMNGASLSSSSGNTHSFTLNTVPEPATAALSLLALATMTARRRRA